MALSETAFIVGFGPGVAAAVADAFAAQGYSLALFARDGEKLDRAAETYTAKGLLTRPYVADAGDARSLAAAIAQARRDGGDPEILVYNAAAWRSGPLLATTPEHLDADFRVSVTGALVAARALAPAMVAERRGAMLFTGGGFALHPSAAAPTLSIGKAGLRAFALMLATELCPQGVRVATVTIAGSVAEGTPFAPARIAAAFVAAHRAPTKPELLFDGQGADGFQLN